MKKLILLGFAALLVLVIAAVVVGMAMIDSLARKAVESGGAYALGAQTTLADMDVRLLGGEVELSGLRVANPVAAGTPSFQSDHFLRLDDGELAVSLRSLRQPTVTVPRLALEDLDINLEKRGGQTNYGVILENLKKLTGDDGRPKPQPADEKRFVISDLDIRNIVVRVDLIEAPAAVGELTRITVPIDRIRLSNVGQTGTGVGGTGVTLSELAGIIVKAVLSAAAEKGGDIIPGDILGDLRTRLDALGNIDDLKMQVVAEAKGKVEDLGKKALEEGQKKLDEVTEQGKKAVDEAAEKLKGLIPGKK